MKKIKWMIMTLVVSLSIGGALATAPQGDCRTQPQFYMVLGGGYMPAGTYGVNYACDASLSTCTYTTDGFGNYFPCRSGSYHFIQLNSKSGK
ncbi:MAG: hypothetical protein JST42_13030 [Bacteroidetes bacterium]|nr:hypothetical protein [Bacteroidota bacterium]